MSEDERLAVYLNAFRERFGSEPRRLNEYQPG
jgi:hypothetical protein